MRRNTLATLARATPLYGLVRSWRDWRELSRWQNGARHGAAPHAVKRRALLDHRHRFALDVLVETGTYMGMMVNAMQPHFRRVVSIELDPALSMRAKARFRQSPNVEIRQGDSATELPAVLSTIDGPTLFWLDAHFSGGVTARAAIDTPIEAELRLILGHRSGDRHVILIDDARCFDGTHDYPTLDAVRAVVNQMRNGHRVTVNEDIIRIHADR